MIRVICLAVVLISPAAVGAAETCGKLSAPAPAAPVPEGYKLVYNQTFDKPESLEDFEFTSPDKWRWVERKGVDGNATGAMESLGRGKYRTKVRSPYVIGLVSGKKFGSFVLEADLLQTGKEYGHRDMCMFLNFSTPSQYYYVHMATKADPHAHNVFLVNDKPRTAIATRTTKGIDWGKDKWHHVRLERDVKAGTIRVFYDDMKTPIMEAKDKTFDLGQLGFGSFDDVGIVDNVRVWSDKVVTSKKQHFWKPGQKPSEAKKNAQKD